MKALSRLTLLSRGPYLWTGGSYLFPLPALLFYLIFTTINSNQSPLSLEGSDGNTKYYESKAKGIESASTCCLPKALASEACSRVPREISRCTVMLHMLASRELSLYFERFRRLGKKLKRGEPRDCAFSVECYVRVPAQALNPELSPCFGKCLLGNAALTGDSITLRQVLVTGPCSSHCPLASTTWV